jgi:hypothetical protein
MSGRRSPGPSPADLALSSGARVPTPLFPRRSDCVFKMVPLFLAVGLGQGLPEEDDGSTISTLHTSAAQSSRRRLFSPCWGFLSLPHQSWEDSPTSTSPHLISHDHLLAALLPLFSLQGLLACGCRGELSAMINIHNLPTWCLSVHSRVEHPSDKPGPAGDELPASRAFWISLHHIGEGSNSELQSGRLSSKLDIGQVDEN